MSDADSALPVILEGASRFAASPASSSPTKCSRSRHDSLRPNWVAAPPGRFALGVTAGVRLKPFPATWQLAQVRRFVPRLWKNGLVVSIAPLLLNVVMCPVGS
jgi:hypothetical protein